MKFSLKAIFALVTLSCLLALVYQQMLVNDKLIGQKNTLVAEIETFDPNLEAHLPHLRKAIEPDDSIEKLLEQVEENFTKTLESRQPSELSADHVSVFHIPSIEPKLDVEIKVHVPKNHDAVLTVEFIPNRDKQFHGSLKAKKNFNASFLSGGNVELQLPRGMSALNVSTIEIPNVNGTIPVDAVSVLLNGENFYQNGLNVPPGVMVIGPAWAEKARRVDFSNEKNATPVAALYFFEHLNSGGTVWLGEYRFSIVSTKND